MLFEDAAQAHGATLERRGRSARFGTFAMFSLYPTKNMTSGEGGMVSCADDGGGPQRPAAAQPGHGEAVRQRARSASTTG